MKMFSLVFFVTILLNNATSQILSPAIDSIPLRDGKKLAADVYLPDTTGGIQYPTILVQTPYNRIWYRLGLPMIGLDLAGSPFAFVILDWRCFYGSAGACISSPDRGEDGFDAVEWIAAQPWSDGQVATWGPSALGRVQYMTAKENPPHLVCAVPMVAGPQYNYLEYFPGGAARDEYIDQLDALGYGMSPILYANPYYNLLWSISESTNFYPDSIRIPMLMIGGWYDHNTTVMLDFFEAARTSSDISVRDQHKLLMGPWVHGGHGSAYVGTDSAGQLSYPAAAGVSDSMAFRFLKYYLLNDPNGWDTLSPVINFQTGSDEWQYINEWPSAILPETNIYLRSDGTLNNTPSSANSDSLTFQFDPRDPSPTVGGPTLRADMVQGPYDQAPVVESRNDILVFTTTELPGDVMVQGYPKVVLFVTSDCKDTDFAVRLTDVYPDGRSMLLVDGIRRARFRNGFSTADTASMQAGVVYEVEVELNPISHTFKSGHHIRIDVTSSNYPRFNANMNDGGPMYTDGDTTIANNTIHCSLTHPSRLILPTDPFMFVSELSVQEQLISFPNPANQSVQIVLPETMANQLCDVVIINSLGEVTSMKCRSEGETLILNISGWSPGSYVIQITNGNVMGKAVIMKH